MEKIIRLSDTAFEVAVVKAAQCLENGGIVALPTDTIYGLTTTLNNADKLFELKNRSRHKPMALFLNEISDIAKWAIPTIDNRLIRRLLPGPVTLVFSRSSRLPPSFNEGHRTVGLRIPNHQFVRAVSKHLGGIPLAQTSANLSNANLNPVSIGDFEDLWPSIDLIIDNGVIRDPHGMVSRRGSTVVSLSIPGTYSIVRDGCVRTSTEELLRDYGLTAITDREI